MITANTLFRSHLSKKAWSYWAGFFFLLITCFSQVFQPRLLGYTIDFFAGKEIPQWLVFQTVKETFLALVGAYLLMNIVRFFGRYGWRMTIARETHYAAKWLRLGIWDQVKYFPQEHLDSEFTPGVVMSSSTSDVSASKFLFGFTLVGISDVVFMGGFTLIMMSRIDLEVTFFSILSAPLVYFLGKKIASRERLEFDTAQEYLSKFNDKTSQAISTVRLQRLTQTGAFWEERLLSSASEYRLRRLKALFLSYRFFPLMGSAVIISYGVLFFFGVSKVSSGLISAGDFVALQGLILLLQDPIIGVGEMVSEWQKSKASLERIAQYHNHTKDERLTKESTPTSVNSFSPEVFYIEKLSFAYPRSEKKLFRDFNLHLQEGERLGLIGPIGSGKSTLVQIMAGLIHYDEGKIFFNGRPLESFSHEELRQLISIVPQRPFLFADTVRKNLCLDRAYSDQEIWHGLQLAEVADDVRNLPAGLETILGEWGVNLSGGQKQRLTLARAIIRRPQLLLLDDCLSAVDTMTEEKILKNIDRELRGTSIIWVAHRASTLKYCNRILEINKNE